MQSAELAGEQAGWLTSQLTGVASVEPPMKRPSDLNALISDAVILGSYGDLLNIELDIENGLPDLFVDPGQFRQVLSNLIINARQAMQKGSPLAVSASRKTLRAPLSDVAKPGDYICISVTDFGTGICESIRDKIFDPNFTTKVGGSGLGLTTSFAIMQQHSGHLDFESEEGIGTTFYLYFPVERHPA